MLERGKYKTLNLARDAVVSSCHPFATLICLRSYAVPLHYSSLFNIPHQSADANMYCTCCTLYLNNKNEKNKHSRCSHVLHRLALPSEITHHIKSHFPGTHVCPDQAKLGPHRQPLSPTPLLCQLANVIHHVLQCQSQKPVSVLSYVIAIDHSHSYGYRL